MTMTMSDNDISINITNEIIKLENEINLSKQKLKCLKRIKVGKKGNAEHAMEFRDTKRLSLEKEYNQLLCLSFIYAYRSNFTMRLSKKQLRYNKKGSYSIFELMDGNNPVNMDDLAKEGNDLMNDQYQKTYVTNGNKTIHKRNCLNAYYINRLNLPKKYIRMTDRKIESKSVPFIKVDIPKYLGETFNLDYSALITKLTDWVEMKRSKKYPPSLELTSSEMESFHEGSTIPKPFLPSFIPKVI